MYGYAGKIARIELSDSTVKTSPTKKELTLHYLGGKGFGAKILFEEVPPRIDPFDPSNGLIFTTGPVNGLSLSGAAKFCAVFKSPLTEAWGESQCGGFFGPQLKFAGYDGLVIKGKSKKPVYILIDDEKIEIRNALHLWGKDTYETEQIIKKDNDNRFQVISIGPAGENLVRYACISHDKGRQLGRSGAGAVMGSKRLKAVAVRGSGQVEIADPDALQKFRVELNQEVRKRLKSLTEYGTSAMMALTSSTGTLPTRNWKKGEFEHCEEISAEAMQKIVQRKSSCYACVVACRKISKVKTGPYQGIEVDGPEYETLFAFGSLCENRSLAAIVKANDLCDRLGLDTISAGSALAFAMESYERKILTTKDTGGIKLTFGNHEAMISMLGKIARREGVGNILAEGVKRAAERLGKNSEKFSIHVKGLEPPGYDPRELKGVALSYAVSGRGACHLRSMTYRPDLTALHPFIKDKKVDRLAYDNHAEIVKEQEDFYSLIDSMVLCKFVCLPTIGPINWEELSELYTIITGFEIKVLDLVSKAERINNLTRLFNLREGMTRADDCLPERFHKETLRTKSSLGQKVEKESLDGMLDTYYRLRGWNKAGKPKNQSIRAE